MTDRTVLLVEDEYLVRLTASEVLRDAGYTVIEAMHAHAALNTLAGQAADVHLLFTDIHMPGEMDGLALAHHASTYWPWIKSLIASGRARPPDDHLPAGSRFLPKPYLPSVMVAHVQDLVGDGYSGV